MEVAVSSGLQLLNTTTSDLFVMQTDAKSIKTGVKSLKNRKAVGLDEINNQQLKALPNSVFEFLSSLFNCCFRLFYFPVAWKHAKVIALPKVGKNVSDATSYRPISLLSSLSKIFEKLIKMHLDVVVEDLQIISQSQFGFRRGHSTTQQLCRLVSHIKTNLQNKNSTLVLALDIEKAFDSVWHKGLIYKMFLLQIPPHICKIIESFISDRQYSVFVSGKSSDCFDVLAGVPQGSVLGPILYSIYIADIPVKRHCKLALFADDTCIYSSGKDANSLIDSMNTYLASLHNFFHRWKIKINTSKTQAMFFTRMRARHKLPQKQLLLNNNVIPFASSLKYLGVILDKSLRFHLNTEERIRKVTNLTRSLYPLINRRSVLSLENKLLIFKMIFVPTLTYACPVWFHMAHCYYKKLQISQNKFFKMILDLPYFQPTTLVHMEADISFISEFINKCFNKFQEKCKTSPNPLVNKLV